MKKEIKHALLTLLALTLLFFGGYLIGRNSVLYKGCEIAVDTITVVDTVSISEPTPQKEESLGYDMVTIPKEWLHIDGDKSKHILDCLQTDSANGYTDSLNLLDSFQISNNKYAYLDDSVQIALPLGQKIYKDSLYEVGVTGYLLGDYPKVDYIDFYKPTTIITRTIKDKDTHWSFGPSISYGWTPKGWAYQIGVSWQYKLIER